jgi:hypothetical protein
MHDIVFIGLDTFKILGPTMFSMWCLGLFDKIRLQGNVTCV